MQDGTNHRTRSPADGSEDDGSRARTQAGEDLAYTECRFSCDGVSDEHLVSHFTIVEELGRPYRMEARLELTHQQDFEFLELIGRSAELSARGPEGIRKWTGIVAEIVHVEKAELGRVLVTVVVVPALCA